MSLQIWDFSSQLNALAESEDDSRNGDSAALNQAPLHKFGHKDEGYAIDWSPLVPGRLISGTLLFNYISCFFGMTLITDCVPVGDLSECMIFHLYR